MTTEYHNKPPKIIHGEGKPDKQNISIIIAAAARNAKLSKKQFSLLSFYANRSEGFTPAKKYILEETGLSAKRLRYVRNSLQDMNLIDYEYSGHYHFIFINWLVIRGLAMLEHPLDVGGIGHSNFCRMNQQVISKHPRHHELENRQKKPLKYSIGTIGKDVPAETKRWLQIVGQWTAEEYIFIANSLMNAYGIKPVLPVENEPETHCYFPHSSAWSTSSWEDCFQCDDSPIHGEPLPF